MKESRGAPPGPATAPRRGQADPQARFADTIDRVRREVITNEYWGLPLFLALFAVTFTLFVFLVTIYESLGLNILPLAAVFIFLSAVFWVIDPLMKERLPVFASNVILIALYLFVCQILLIAAGGLRSPLFVVYSFVVFTGAMSYGLTGSVIVTGIVAAAYATFIEEAADLPAYFIRIIVLWIVALMVGFLAETKRRVEKREALQGMRLTALNEVARFMRELSRPEDVIEAGLEALQRLLDASAVALCDGPRILHQAGLTSRSPSLATGERFPLEVVELSAGHAGSPALGREVVILRPGQILNADEQRIVRLLLEKMQLIWMHLSDKAAIEQVRAEKERVLDSIGTGVVTLGSDGVFQTLNRRAAEILDADSATVAGRAATAAPWSFPPPDGFGPVSREVEIGSAKGEKVPVEMRVMPAHDAAGGESGWIVVFDDLKELRRLTALIRRSEALAAVGEMSARVAHEIRNPLGGILGFLSLAEHKTGPDIIKYIRQAKEAVMRLENVVRDLLTFARPIPREAGSFRLVDVWSSLEQTERARESAEIARPRVVIHPLPSSLDELRLRGDTLLFGQVVENIVRNAREAAGRDGSVVMRARWGDPCIWIEIDDDGPGWPPDMADKLFEPFASSKETGSGLGLAIARRIVEQLGGSIQPGRTKNEEGRAVTRFRIAWPRA